MTLRSLFLTDAIENLKRRTWIFGGSFLIFFCCYPGFLLLNLNRIKNSGYSTMEDRIVYMQNSVEALFTENVIIACLVIALGIIFGIQGFSYLHDKRQVNFYHSQPVKRSRRFLVLWANGVFLFFLSYMINFILGIAAAAGYGCLQPEFIVSGIKGAALYFVLFLSIYHVSMTAVMLTGHTLVSILAVGVLLLYEMAVRGIIIWYKETFFLTNVMTGDEVLYSLTSPLASIVGYFKYGEKNYPWYEEIFSYPKILGHLLILTVSFGIIAYVLYQKRPMEGYGKNISFKIVKEPIRIALLIVVGVAGGLLFHEMAGNSIIFGILGVIFTLFLGHVIIQMIYEVDLRAVRKNLTSAAVALVCSIMVLFFFRYDPLGMDGKIPDKGKVAGVGIELPGVETRGNYWISESGEEFWGIEYSRNMMCLRELSPVYDALNQSIKPKKFRSIMDENESREETYYTIAVTFYKKNGRKEEKRLYYKKEEIGQIFNEIYRMREYQNVVNQTTTENFLEKYKIKEAEYFNGLNTTALNNSAVKALYEAYQKDLSTAEYKEIFYQIPLGKLVFKGEGLQLKDYVNRWEVLIYPGYTNTIAVLKQQEAPWKADFSQDFLEMVDHIMVTETDYESWGYTAGKNREDYTRTVIYKDKEEIRNLLRDALPRENMYWSNGITPYNSGNNEIEIQVVRSLGEQESKEVFGNDYQGNGRSVTEITYENGEIPAVIKADLESTPYGESLSK